MDKTMRFNHQQVRQEHKSRPAARVNGSPLHSITAVIRAVEFFVFLAVISRFTLTFPNTVLNLSGYYFSHVTITFVSTPFIFILGNAIVVTLILKSGSKNSQYEEAPQPKTTFIVSVYSSSAAKNTVVGKATPATEVKASCYRRTKSEKMAGERKPEVLRRTKTETVQRRVTRTCKGSYLENHMSGDEFRRTVEDFIARQQRILKEEENEDSFSDSE